MKQRQWKSMGGRPAQWQHDDGDGDSDGDGDYGRSDDGCDDRRDIASLSSLAPGT